MKSTTLIITALLAVGLTTGYSSLLTNLTIDNDNEASESRNIFQQLVINQIVNAIPQSIREKINGIAALLSMTRDDFLVRCLKELQAFQTYSKTDSITAIQKIVKFINERLTFDQQNELKTMESEGLQLIALMVTNQIKPGQLNKLYDLIVKIVRHQIDGETFMNEVPTILNEILVQHF